MAVLGGSRAIAAGRNACCLAISSRLSYASGMEHIVNLHIEKLPEGVYLATSDDVAQGRAIAGRLIEAQRQDGLKQTSASVSPTVL